MDVYTEFRLYFKIALFCYSRFLLEIYILLTKKFYIGLGCFKLLLGAYNKILNNFIEGKNKGAYKFFFIRTISGSNSLSFDRYSSHKIEIGR